MSFFLNLKLKRSVRAFTLIETLVSVMIITTVILGPLTIAMGASSYARQTKDTMVASYLAQEALELLHHQQDSVFLRCIGQSDTCPIPIGETPSQTAWRIFHDRLAANAQGASCFSTDNGAGCAYDFINMTSDEDFSPTKYSFSSNSCSRLSESPQHFYVCAGAHGQEGYKDTSFSRTISITSIPTFDANYNNDLRVTVTVSFRRSTGYTRQIKVIDFLHARA